MNTFKKIVLVLVLWIVGTWTISVTVAGAVNEAGALAWAVVGAMACIMAVALAWDWFYGVALAWAGDWAGVWAWAVVVSATGAGIFSLAGPLVWAVVAIGGTLSGIAMSKYRAA